MKLIDLLNVIEDYEEVEVWLPVGGSNQKIYNIDTALGAIRNLTPYHDFIVTGVESYPRWDDDSYISIDIKEEERK